MKTIVVGVDGSPGASAALEFAAHEAAAHGARLRVICAWEPAYAAYAGGFIPPADMISSLQEYADRVAREAAELAVELEPSIYVEHEAVEGHPAEVLVGASRAATLVVVGSRGHGGFASMLLGSVGHEVAQHAGCAVAIVPKAVVQEQDATEADVAAAV